MFEKNEDNEKEARIAHFNAKEISILFIFVLFSLQIQI